MANDMQNSRARRHLETLMGRSKHPDPIDQHVGDRVRLRRQVQSVSQEKLADALGLTFQQVQKYETGRNRISSSKLQRIGQVLGVSPAYFLEGLPASDGSAAAEKDDAHAVAQGDDAAALSRFLATTEGKILMRVFPAISDVQVRRDIVRLVTSLASRDAAFD